MYRMMELYMTISFNAYYDKCSGTIMTIWQIETMKVLDFKIMTITSSWVDYGFVTLPSKLRQAHHECTQVLTDTSTPCPTSLCNIMLIMFVNARLNVWMNRLSHVQLVDLNPSFPKIAQFGCWKIRERSTRRLDSLTLGGVSGIPRVMWRVRPLKQWGQQDAGAHPSHGTKNGALLRYLGAARLNSYVSLLCHGDIYIYIYIIKNINI